VRILKRSGKQCESVPKRIAMIRSLYTSTLFAILFTGMYALNVSAQTEFDVASIKLNKEAGSSLLQVTPGRFSATAIPLNRLLILAYNVQDFQVMDAPSWTRANRYDISARAGDDTTVQQMEGPMLQRLLEERFNLRSHRETRILPLYELTLADKGPKFRLSEAGSCTPYVKNAQPAVVGSDHSQPSFCGFHRTSEGGRVSLTGKGVSVAELAANLSHSYNTSLERNVVDRTGLAGGFDITLRWTNRLDSSHPSDAGLSESPDDSSIFLAVQEQLGLKLRAGKGAVEVLVIDHIEPPSPN
jgi:uncharacterized protein (TIGR03435 family)